MNRNIFLVIGVFFAVFLGILFGIIAFLKKIKRKKSFDSLEKDEFKEDFEKKKDNIVEENTKEWEKFNG